MDTDTHVLPGGTAITDDGRLAAIGVGLWKDCLDINEGCEFPLYPYIGRIYLFDLDKNSITHVINEEIPVDGLILMEKKHKLISMTCTLIDRCDERVGMIKVWDMDTGLLFSAPYPKSTYNGITVLSHNENYIANATPTNIEVWRVDSSGVFLLVKL